MNATQRKRLLKLADFIVAQVPKEKFDMAQYGVDFGELDTDCGTAGCALGWCTVLFRRAGCTVYYSMPAYNSRVGFGVGMELFGLTYAQSKELFSVNKRKRVIRKASPSRYFTSRGATRQGSEV